MTSSCLQQPRDPPATHARPGGRLAPHDPWAAAGLAALATRRGEGDPASRITAFRALGGRCCRASTPEGETTEMRYSGRSGHSARCWAIIASDAQAFLEERHRCICKVRRRRQIANSHLGRGLSSPGRRAAVARGTRSLALGYCLQCRNCSDRSSTSRAPKLSEWCRSVIARIVFRPNSGLQDPRRAPSHYTACFQDGGTGRCPPSRGSSKAYARDHLPLPVPMHEEHDQYRRHDNQEQVRRVYPEPARETCSQRGQLADAKVSWVRSAEPGVV